MNPAMKEAILESCLSAVRLLNEHRTSEAIRALREVQALMALDRRVEETTIALCIEGI